MSKHNEIRRNDEPIVGARKRTGIKKGDRQIPVSLVRQRFGGTLPQGTAHFHPRDGYEPVVIACPVVRVPVTDRMIKAVHSDAEEWQRMVLEETPLGIAPNEWKLVQHEIVQAFDRAGLGKGLVVKVGGSSVSGVTSFDTVRKKKRLPTTPAALDKQIERALKKGKIEPQDERYVHKRGLDLQQSVLSELPIAPVAPWWGAMHEIGLETFPDIDVQIYCPALDAVMLETYADHIDGERADDLWNRWRNSGVEAAVPQLKSLQRWLSRKFPTVELEYLAGIDGRQRIQGRTDWWTITDEGKGVLPEAPVFASSRREAFPGAAFGKNALDPSIAKQQIPGADRF